MDTGNTSHILGYSLIHFDCQYADRRYNNQFKSLKKLELELKHCKRHLTSVFCASVRQQVQGLYHSSKANRRLHKSVC